MLISTKGRYALRAVVDIAENSGAQPGAAGAARVSLKSVSKRQNISEKYLEAIIKPLVVAGILTSMRGKNGGYTLSRPAAEITAGEVIRAVEGAISTAPCVGASTEKCERQGACRTIRFWDGLEKTIGAYLDSTTIADLAIPDLGGNDYVI